MRRIISPLRPAMQGAAVADLQEALRLCLDRTTILGNDAGARQELSAALSTERQTQSYGGATRKLVGILQETRHLPVTGEVDEATASALNLLLREWAVLDQSGEGAPRSLVVSGQLRREDSRPLGGMRMRAAHVAASAATVGALRLGEDTTDAEGRYTIRYEPLPTVDSINLCVTAFDANGRVLHASDVIRGPQALEIVDVVVPAGDIKAYRVDGKVASRLSAGVGGLRIMIVDKGVGDDVPLCEATTDDGGGYQTSFSDELVRRRGKSQPDLQARVFAGVALLGASVVRYNASERETLNILLDDTKASALPSEHDALTSALSSQFNGKLGDLKEAGERQDITFLANKTGWDARAVALAALADQFSARTGDATGAQAIPQAFLYALFRAGLPANEDALYHTDAKTLEAVWTNAAEQGVIPQTSPEQISALVGRFQDLSAQKLLTDRPWPASRPSRRC